MPPIGASKPSSSRTLPVTLDWRCQGTKSENQTRKRTFDYGKVTLSTFGLIERAPLRAPEPECLLPALGLRAARAKIHAPTRPTPGRRPNKHPPDNRNNRRADKRSLGHSDHVHASGRPGETACTPNGPDNPSRPLMTPQEAHLTGHRQHPSSKLVRIFFGNLHPFDAREQGRRQGSCPSLVPGQTLWSPW